MLKSKDINLLRADVAKNCRIFLDLCKKAGYDVLVTDTVRDQEYQQQCYDKGYASTNIPSFHAVDAGLAFDVCKNVKGHEYDDLSFFTGIAKIGKEIGFSWGGDWKSFPDKPHFQWDNHGKYTSTMIRKKQYPPTMPEYIEDEELDISKLTDKECYEILKKANAYAGTLPEPTWAKAELAKAKEAGLYDGTRPQAFTTRCEDAISDYRVLAKK